MHLQNSVTTHIANEHNVRQGTMRWRLSQTTY